MINKLDAIVVDLKESIEDFGHEVKNIMDRTKKIEQKLHDFEEELSKLRKIAEEKLKDEKKN